MDQETKWRQKYEEVKDFVEKNHRNPSKHDAEERGRYLNWVKHNKKLFNARELKAERAGDFKELLALMEENRHINQYA